VTHDQEEALSISDEVVVMNRGKAEQVGSPFDIYNKPKTRFVATFVGTLNILKGMVVSPEDGLVRIDGMPFRLPSALSLPKGSEVSIAIRPENIKLGGHEACDISVPAEIVEVAFLGSVIRLKARLLGTLVEFDVFNEPSNPPPSTGTTHTIGLSSRDLIALDE
jgi:putative spermidine/putrescine transport system ATP-binding protein